MSKELPYRRTADKKTMRREIRTHEQEQSVLDDFVIDVKIAIRDSTELYPEMHEGEKDALLKTLLQKTVEHIPEFLHNDPCFWIDVMTTRACPFTSIDQIYIFLEAAPDAVKRNAAFLNELQKWQPFPYEQFVALLPQHLHTQINEQWLGESWAMLIDQLKNDTTCIEPDKIPWQNIVDDQQQKLMRALMRDTPTLAFDNMPHHRIDREEWLHAYSTLFGKTLEKIEAELWQNDSQFASYHELHALADWPAEYRTVPNDFKPIVANMIRESFFDAQLITAIEKNMGPVLLELDLFDEAQKQLSWYIQGYNITKAKEVASVLPENTHFPYAAFFEWCKQNRFSDQETQTIYNILQEESSPVDMDNLSVQDMRDNVLQYAYGSYHTCVEALGGDSQIKDLLWEALPLQDKEGTVVCIQECVERFWAEIDDRQELDATMGVLRQLFESIQTEEDRELLGSLVNGLNKHTVEMLQTHSVFEGEAALPKGARVDISRLHAELKIYQIGKKIDLNIFEHQLNHYSADAAYQEIQTMRRELSTLRRTVTPPPTKTEQGKIDTLEQELHELIQTSRLQKELTREVLASLSSELRQYIKKNPQATAKNALDEIFHQQLYGAVLPKDLKQLVEQKIGGYIKKYHVVRKFYEDYKDRPEELAIKAIWGLSSVCESVKMEVRGISLIFYLEAEDYRKVDSRQSAGVALTYSEISDLTGTIVVIKDTPWSGDYERIIAHENRHQEDKIFFDYNNPINSAKTEILAFMAGGDSASYTRRVLTDKGGLYYYYGVQEESAWRRHCQRVERAVDIAFQIRDTDLLALTPIQEWSKLLSHPSEQKKQQTSIAAK